jgi:hypothetical protein
MKIAPENWRLMARPRESPARVARVKRKDTGPAREKGPALLAGPSRDRMQRGLLLRDKRAFAVKG